MGEDNKSICNFRILNASGEEVGQFNTPNIPEIHLTGEEINTPIFHMDEGEITISMQIDNGEEFQRKLGIEPRWGEFVDFVQKCILHRLATKPKVRENYFHYAGIGKITILHFVCPTCGKLLASHGKHVPPHERRSTLHPPFCDMCGQYIDWSEAENE